MDGTVRRSKSGKTFITGPDDIELIPGMKELIWKYKKHDYCIVGISNQGGVAHGFKTPSQNTLEMNATVVLIEEGYTEAGKPIAAIISCPYDAKGTVEEYNWRSLCRKPDYGMLVRLEHLLLESDHFPDWDNSLFVGDRPEDEECAKRAGVRFLHIDEFLKESL